MKRLLLVIIFIAKAADFSFAESFSMANIQSVYSESSINALRNPALIMAQPWGSVFFAAALYNPYKKTENDVSVDVVTNVSVTESSYYSGGLFLAYSTKGENFGFGIGLSNGSNEQVSYSVSKIVLSSNKDETRELGISPMLQTSFAFKLDSGQFFGFQIGLGYSHQYVKKEKVTASEIFKTNTDIFYADIAFGYLAKDEKSEVGLIFKPGKYILRRDRMYYENSIPSSGTAIIPFYSRYDSAISLTAGGYHKILPEIGVALEFVYVFPSTRNEKFFDDFNGFPPTIKTYNINAKEQLLFKVGTDFKLNKSIVINLGTGYLNAQVESDKNGKQSIESDYYLITAGLDYLFENRTKLSLASNISYSETELKWNAQGSSSFNMNVKSKVFNVGALIGFSYSY